MPTPATAFLDRAGIEYELLPYDHDPAAESYGLEAAEALGLDADLVFKTLMARLDVSEQHRGQLVVAIVPVSSLLSLKSLARAANAKRARMADIAEAERSSGYVAGGISPFGQKQALATYVDETMEICDRVYVSGGQRGLDIAVNPADLVTALNATIAPLASRSTS